MRHTTETWPGMGDRIRQRIRELGYQRVEDFTQDKRYSLGLFYKWMGEKVYPSKTNILRLARDLDVTLRWLMWGTATHIEGVPVDLLARPPAHLQPATFEEKRALMGAAFTKPMKKKPKPKRARAISGGSAALENLATTSGYYVKRTLRWLGWTPYRRRRPCLQPQVALAA